MPRLSATPTLPLTADTDCFKLGQLARCDDGLPCSHCNFPLFANKAPHPCTTASGSIHMPSAHAHPACLNRDKQTLTYNIQHVGLPRLRRSAQAPASLGLTQHRDGPLPAWPPSSSFAHQPHNLNTSGCYSLCHPPQVPPSPSRQQNVNLVLCPFHDSHCCYTRDAPSTR